MNLTHDAINLTVDTSYLSWAPPPTKQPAFEKRIGYFIILFLLIFFLLLRHYIASRHVGRMQLAASSVSSMEREVCCICEGETLHHLHDTMLRTHCIANRFNEYWLDNQLPAMKEAELIIIQCREFMKNHNERLKNMCMKFQESDIS